MAGLTVVADAPLVRQVRLAALVSSLALLVQGAVVISVPAAIIGAGGALLGDRRATGHPPAFDDGQLPPGPDGAGPHGRDPG